MAYTYSKIATYTVGSGGVASIDFLNIPQTYTDLVIKLSTRDTFASTQQVVNISFNGLTTNLSYKQLFGLGSGTPGSNGFADGSSGGYSVSANATANTFGNSEVYITNYTSSNNKSWSTDSVTENNATAAVTVLTAALWSNTAPITSIKLTPTSGSFVQHSTAHLYGIKAEL